MSAGLVSAFALIKLSLKSVTEVLDDVTYGATLGLAASNGAVSFGLSLNYTGSSNTDELGLQAHARLSF